jgi:AraC-like DNA-binding protein
VKKFASVKNRQKKFNFRYFMYFSFMLCPVVEKAMSVRVLSAIDFFMGDDFESIDCSTGQADPFERCTVRGPRTRKLCIIRLKGHFISFSIKLKPAGLFCLTGIPMRVFTDRAIPGDLVDPLPLKIMTERLLSAQDLSDCIRIVEPYLLIFAEKRRLYPCAAERATRQLISKKMPFSMVQLARESNLSLRQLERVFIREIGVNPKTFYRMHRFRQLIQARINEPAMKWAAMTDKFCYYDQMHLIRDFRQFLGISPSDFVPADFAF